MSCFDDDNTIISFTPYNIFVYKNEIIMDDIGKQEMQDYLSINLDYIHGMEHIEPT